MAVKVVTQGSLFSTALGKHNGSVLLSQERPKSLLSSGGLVLLRAAGAAEGVLLRQRKVAALGLILVAPVRRLL